MKFSGGDSHGVFAVFWRRPRPLLAVLLPARHSSQLFWAIHTLVVDLRVVPEKAFEIFAAILESLIVEGVTLAVFIRVLATDHPHSACLRMLEGLFVLV